MTDLLLFILLHPFDVRRRVQDGVLPLTLSLHTSSPPFLRVHDLPGLCIDCVSHLNAAFWFRFRLCGGRGGFYFWVEGHFLTSVGSSGGLFNP